MRYKNISLFRFILFPNQGKENGFGFFMSLGLGLMFFTILLSSLTSAASRKLQVAIDEDAKQAQALGESGISRYQSFLVSHPKLAVYPDCEGTRNSSGVCPDTASTASWSNAGSIPDVTNSTQITNAAQTSWQDADPSDPSKGQFRLISYSFDDDGNPATAPDPTAAGTGTLIVEGRVNQTAASAAISTTRVEVSFDVTPGAGSGDLNGEGLWITCNNDSSTSHSDSEIQTNVKDSTSVSADNPPGSGTAACTSSTSKIDALKLQQKVNGVIPTPPFTYDISSEKFPTLPMEGLLTNVPGTGVCTTSNAIGNAVTLPAPCNHPEIGGTVSNIYNTYHLTGSTGINFTGGGDILTIDAPGQTVKLYLNGELKVTHSGAGIVVTPGTTLIIYAHGAITLNGGSGIGGPLSNPGTPDQIQIYQYVSDDLRLTGGSGTNAFIFAPLAQVSMTGASAIRGAVWARSYSATGGSDIIGSAGTVDCSNLPSGFCDAGGENQIHPIKSWERKPVN